MGEEGLSVFVVLRIVEGVWIVFLRIEFGGMGLFGDLVDKGSGLCISLRCVLFFVFRGDSSTQI